MRSKYLFVRYRLPLSVSRKFLTTSSKHIINSLQINAQYFETLKYDRLPFNKHLLSLVCLEKTLQKKKKLCGGKKKLKILFSHLASLARLAGPPKQSQQTQLVR